MSTRTFTTLVQPVQVTASDNTVPIGTDSTDVLAEAPNRRLLILKNTDPTDTIYVSLDGDAATTDDLSLPPGEGIVLDVCVPTNAIKAIASANTPKLYTSEG